MTDPYKVLNVPSTATDEEVKKAYRDLARKYHPDNYHDNPLADLAQEKMKEVNEAYDTIQRQRSGRAHGGGSAASGAYQQQSWGGYQTAYSGYDGAAGTVFAQVRMAISRNDLSLAEQMLARIDDHNGEWNFLKGTICVRRGWIDEARRYYQNACQMSPGNREYRQALERLENGQQGYRPEGYEVFSTGCGDNLCARLACTYLMCNVCTCGSMRVFFC
ncbi:MAG: DnaJ domain-containing protein [Oscillospiraceae bacterium]|nr:DnaJ domain-containing protein [Oscillospiraceae bacterium]